MEGESPTLRHLTNSSREAQEIIDSDTEHSQKIMKVSSLKTQTMLSNVKKFNEKNSNGLEQEDRERENSHFAI